MGFRERAREFGATEDSPCGCGRSVFFFLFLNGVALMTTMGDDGTFREGLQ
jgi:hypothetical protein